MNPSDHSLANHRYHRLDAPASRVLPTLCHSSSLYVHARNWMAEMAAITPLTESLIDDDGAWISFPEQGLNLSLNAIQQLHSITTDHPCRSSLALEIATHGEPRAVSIAATSAFSDIENFASRLSSHPLDSLSAETYGRWREGQLIRPTACTCCAAAAEARRKNLEASPLAKIISNSIDEERMLHCRLSSPAFRFAQSFVPANLLYTNGHIGATGSDHLSLLEIDPGLCHSMVLQRRTIDAEPMTSIRIYNSLGVAELTIETPGFEAYDGWVEFCKG